MKTIKVKDLMVPLDKYATISEEANLYEAILTLEEAHRHYDKRRYKYRAILVLDKNKKIVGMLTDLEVLSGLEPAYKEIGDVRTMALSGISQDFLKSLAENYQLWQKPLGDICGKAFKIKVKNIDYTTTEGNFIEEEATLDQAIHQLIVGYHQNVLVTREGDNRIVGILRLYDVFKKVASIIKRCKIDDSSTTLA
ncbi:MAG: CBS domain-containing protein [Deltaproteobacteria bacterium]|nr:CBS domain-containing protein [Deltaproteobacteria bacterium]